MHFEKQMKELAKRKARALEMGGTEKIKKHHDKGKLTARERIDRLLDPDTFLDSLAADCVDLVQQRPGIDDHTVADNR